VEMLLSPQPADSTDKIAIAPDDGRRRFERHRAVVGLLLRLERADEAEETARRWAGEAGPTPEQLATMAELLARHGRQAAAEKLFDAAFRAEDLSSERRYGLLCRRAAIAKGQPRWKLLLEAAKIVPVGSPGRRHCLDLVGAELTDRSQAEVATQLAAGTDDPELKAALLLVEARWHVDVKRRAEAYWRAYKLDRLPEDRAAWACSVWNGAGEPQRVIEFAEAKLRSGQPLYRALAVELEAAYRALGRERDALRAASGDPEPPERSRVSPGSGPAIGGGLF